MQQGGRHMGIASFAILSEVRYMLSPVRLSSVCLSSVTLVCPSQAFEIFGNFSTPFGTIAIP